MDDGWPPCDADVPAAFGINGLSAYIQSGECSDVLNTIAPYSGFDTWCAFDVSTAASRISSMGMAWSPPALDAAGTALDESSKAVRSG